MEIKYPQIIVDIKDRDTLSLIGRVSRSICARISKKAANEFEAEAMEVVDSYEKVLALCERTVQVC